MVFYEIAAEIQDFAEFVEENRDPDRQDRICPSGFDAPAKKTLAESGRQSCVFLKAIKKSSANAILGAIAPNRATTEKQLARFLKLAGIKANKIQISEITMQEMRDMLRMASRYDFIEDEDQSKMCRGISV